MKRRVEETQNERQEISRKSIGGDGKGKEA